MKNSKRILPMYDFYDRTGIQRFLEKQAEKGWMLEKISVLGWKFRYIEPKKLHFSISYFPKASSFDAEPSEDQKRFQDFCYHTGWKLVTTNAQMQIFYNEDEEPIPIETDAMIEVDTIHRATKRGIMPSYLILILLSFLQMGMLVSQMSRSPVSVLLNNASLFTVLCWATVWVFSLIEVTHYFSWYRKAKSAAASDGNFVEVKGHYIYKKILIAFVLFFLVLFLFSMGSGWMIAMGSVVIILILVALILCVSNLMKKLKVSARVNLMITIISAFVLTLVLAGVISFFIIGNTSDLDEAITLSKEIYKYNGSTYNVSENELPLSISDLVNIEYEYESKWQENKSLFLSKYEISQRPAKGENRLSPSVEYTILEVKLPWLYALCKEEMLKEFTSFIIVESRPPEAVPIDAKPWGANEAYQFYTMFGTPTENYLLCYDHCIINILIDLEAMPEQSVTEEMKEIIGEKLSF